VKKTKSNGKPACQAAAQESRPGQFPLIPLLAVTAYIVLVFGILAAFHVITGVDYLTIVGRIALLTSGFAVALAGVAVLLWVICALEQRTTDNQQEPIEAVAVK
jgi:hypothetical protein